MKTLHIPELKREVSRLGAGSMFCSMERLEEAIEVYDAFFAAGGNLIDTAEVYGTEPVIRAWMSRRGNRADVVILEKGCHHPEYELSIPKIHETITKNLEALGTDYIDLWGFHRDNPEVPVEAIVDALNEEVARGRILAFGGSNWTITRLCAANAYAAKHGLMGFAISSPHLCLAQAMEPFWRGCTIAADMDLEWHRHTGMPLVSWSSQGRGFFGDDSSPDNTAKKDLVRVYHNEDNFLRLERARQLARARGVAPIQIALAYVLNVNAPTIALVGPETVEQVQSCVRATEIALSEAEIEWLTLKRETL